MILIISEETDRTTDRVIDWLKYFDKKVLRVNNTDLLNFKNLSILINSKTQ